MNATTLPASQEPATNRSQAVLRLAVVLRGLAILLLAQTGCTDSRPDPEDVLARIGARTLRESEFRQHWDERRPATNAPENRNRVLEQLIERAALAEAARAAGLLDDPVVVEQVEGLLIQRFEETRLKPELEAISIGDAEIRAEYQRSLENLYQSPARIRVAVLWYDTRNRQPLVDRYSPRLQEAIKAAANLPAAEGFGALAIRCSEHAASRYKGGDLGWIDEPSAVSPWHQRILEIASTLREPGDVSPVSAGDQGLFVVRLLERQESTVKSLESVRSGIERRLRSQRRREIADRFRRQVVEKINIRRYPDRLLSMQNLPERGEILTQRSSPASPDRF